MAPQHTESSILASYLLPPSPLPTIIPYTTFLTLLPSSQRTNPTLQTLYRDLQFQRNIDIDSVRANIAREVARGVGLRAQLAAKVDGELGRKRKHEGDEVEGAVEDVYVSESVHPAGKGRMLTEGRWHTRESLGVAVEEVRRGLEAEIEELEMEKGELVGEITEIVGSLSDLRYGKMVRGKGDGDRTTEDEIAEALSALQTKLRDVLG